MSQIVLGTQGWSYKDWVGVFYPPHAKPESYLRHYCRQFQAVELDSTFYGPPESGRVEGWLNSSPADFVFTAKMPRTITHDRHLVDAADDLKTFLASMRLLDNKLGAVLIQLPPDFKVDERPALQGFLEMLPHDIRFAIELRHRSWLVDQTYQLLRQHNVAWTIIDLPYMPISAEITTDFAYVRLLGDHKKIVRLNETQIDRTDDLEKWAKQLEAVAQKVERVYGFVNNHYSGHSPADVRRLKRMLGIEEKAEVEQLEQGSLL